MGQYTVIGLGSFGYYITKALYSEGNEVIAIDQDKTLVQSLSPFCSQAIVMDATEKETLKTIGLKNMDGIIVSVGAKISSSILICLYLHEMNIKKIIVKAIDEDHVKILEKMGITEIVQPEKEFALRLAKSLTHPNIMDYIPISDEFEIVQLSPPQQFYGKSLSELNLRVKYGVQVIAVKEGNQNQSILNPPSTYKMNKDDTLIILGEHKFIKKIRELK